MYTSFNNELNLHRMRIVIRLVSIRLLVKKTAPYPLYVKFTIKKNLDFINSKVDPKTYRTLDITVENKLKDNISAKLIVSLYDLTRTR